MPTVERAALAGPLPRGFRITFAADFHIRSSTSDAHLDRLCDLLSGMKADLLLLGGDYGETKAAAHRLFDALCSFKYIY